MSMFIPPAPPAPTPPSLMVPVAYSGAGGPEEAVTTGSYGPVIAMLAAVVVLAAAAVAVGRLCFGRRALGHAGGHDLEAWVERTCGPCVGVVTPAPASRGGGPAKEEGGGGSGVTVAVAAATEQRPERGECSSGGGPQLSS